MDYHDLCCGWHLFNPLVFNHSGEIGGEFFVVVVWLTGSSRDQTQALVHAKIFSPLSSIPCLWFWRQSLHVPTVYIAQAGHKLRLLQTQYSSRVLRLQGCSTVPRGWVSLFAFPSRLRCSLAVYVIESHTEPMASLWVDTTWVSIQRYLWIATAIVSGCVSVSHSLRVLHGSLPL